MNRLGTLAFIAIACGIAPAGAAQSRPPIIDMHLHTYHPAEIPPGAPGLCRPEPCRGRGAATASEAESRRAVLEQMHRHNIVMAFLSGPDQEELRRWMDAAPGHFMTGMFMTEPGHPTTAALRRLHKDNVVSGIGEIATQLTGVRPDDSTLAPYFALAEELDLPLLIHVEGIGPQVPGFRSAAGNPLMLEEALVRHPNLRIYVENTGYPFLDQMIAMMNQYPQLYGDLSTITWILPRSAFYQYLRGLMDAGLGKRLMFGSDQMRWPEAIGWAVQAIEEAPFLSAEQKRDIFYNNAVRFLRLEKEGK